MKILVTGASGLLGAKVVTRLSRQHQVVGQANRKAGPGTLKLDLTDFAAVADAFHAEKPDAVVHTAAMTDVDASERDRFGAYLVNAAASFRLADLCRSAGARMVFVSTDYVFDGLASPYFEKDPPHPIQFYGKSKLLGEQLVRDNLPESAVVRVAILYGHNGPEDKATFPRQVVDHLRAGKAFGADDSRLKYPTLIDDVAEGIERILTGRLTGTFHFANPEPMTRLQWARIVAEEFGLPTSLLQVKNERFDLPGKAARPVNVNLVNSHPAVFRATPVREGTRLVRKQMEGTP